jgi:hypothetical protein
MALWIGNSYLLYNSALANQSYAQYIRKYNWLKIELLSAETAIEGVKE